MKRYLLFMGHRYYPMGGWYDLFSSYDTVDSALSAIGARDYDPDWWQVVDSVTGRTILHKG